jgi:hypothetical protein
MPEPILFKRTTAITKRCQFMWDDGTGLIERCEEDADVGMYFGDKFLVNVISLCHYHCINQESIWIGEANE